MAYFQDHFLYQGGFYWHRDGTGPYAFDGTTMHLMEIAIIEQETGDGLTLCERKNFFTRGGVGPVAITGASS